MEPITVGILIGVGATVALARGRQGLRVAVGWTARQIGWASSRVAAAVQETRETARSEYERGRQTTDERDVKLPNGKPNGRDASAS
jgi:hypothetical protein